MYAHIRIHRLGQWMMGAAKLRRRWKVYYDWPSNCVYAIVDDQFHEFVEIAENEFGHGLLREDMIDPPNSAVPIIGYIQSNGRVLVDPASIFPIQPKCSTRVAESFQEYVATLSEWERVLLDDIQFLQGGPFHVADVFLKAGD